MTEPGTLLELIRQVRAQRRTTDALEDERLGLEGSLIEFVEEAWPYVDAAPYQPSWAVEALCEHLQAVTDGRISKLLINFTLWKNHHHVGLLDCVDVGPTRKDFPKWTAGTVSDRQLLPHLGVRERQPDATTDTVPVLSAALGVSFHLPRRPEHESPSR
jgi:hypothetical protein